MIKEEDINIEGGGGTPDGEKMLSEKLLQNKKLIETGSQIHRDDKQFKTAIAGNDKHTIINFTDEAQNEKQRQLMVDDVPNFTPKRVDKKSDINKLIQNVDIKIQEDRDGKNKPMVPFSKLVWTLADRQDKFLFVGGMTSSILCGLGLPSFVFLFGDIADSFEGFLPPDKILDKITHVAFLLTIIGLGVWLFSYFFFSLLQISAESIGAKTKVAYLRSILS